MTGEPYGSANPQVDAARAGSLDELRNKYEWYPEPWSGPLILDTDVGGEPDDALALGVAAGMPSLMLVVTSDEHGGRRARFARYLLDLLGRSDVPVVAGVDLGNEHRWAAEELVPDHIPAQPTDLTAAVSQVLEQHSGQISWVVLGSMSNIAAVLAADPTIGERLIITVQEGAHRYSTDHAQQNFALDLPAARKVLAAGIGPWIVPGEVSFHLSNELDAESREYRVLRSQDPAHILISDHIDQWFEDFSPSATLHGPLTLALGVGMPFLAAAPASVGVDEVGRIGPGNEPVFVVRSVNYRHYRPWLVHRLEMMESVLAHHPTADQVGGQPGRTRRAGSA
ncbi:nucleoside hydrolase [Nocardia sp. NBC_01499]|uniref:nucleoside hydrolase n=1 Tax=Nocardia sp. NBC_01499 TaxID=2903597 RepID=UPI003863E05D